MPRKSARDSKNAERGKLRIGDDWNAIRIIALSQGNPLKAIAEFVENSIDARAKTITITRGREHGEHYLSIRDDGNGVPRDADGLPDFKYVATHICDSIKRRLKADGGGAGMQGEFGIGLLSFWTVGETLTMLSTGADQRAYQMTMSKGDPSFTTSPRRTLFAERGTELILQSRKRGRAHRADGGARRIDEIHDRDPLAYHVLRQAHEPPALVEKRPLGKDDFRRARCGGGGLAVCIVSPYQRRERDTKRHSQPTQAIHPPPCAVSSPPQNRAAPWSARWRRSPGSPFADCATRR